MIAADVDHAVLGVLLAVSRCLATLRIESGSLCAGVV